MNSSINRKIGFSGLLCAVLLGLLHCTRVVQPITDTSPSRFADSNTFQLAAPTIKSGSTFFDQETTLELISGIADVQLHYTFDGSDPTTSSQKYKTPLLINRSVELKVCAFHPDFQPSPIVTRSFIRLPDPVAIDRITINQEPHKNYPGTGAQGLIDRQKGSNNFRTKQWMGFNGGDLEIDLAFPKDLALEKISISLLSDQGSWIFLPESISVQTSKSGVEYFDLVEQPIQATQEGSDLEMTFVDIPLPTTITKYLKIKIESAEGIPDWHSGKGSPPWLFIDEILIDAK
jgi:hypothetical protein